MALDIGDIGGIGELGGLGDIRDLGKDRGDVGGGAGSVGKLLDLFGDDSFESSPAKKLVELAANDLPGLSANTTDPLYGLKLPTQLNGPNGVTEAPLSNKGGLGGNKNPMDPKPPIIM